MSLLIEVLRELLATKEICAFYPWPDGDGCLCGRVVGLDEASVVFAKIGLLGEPEGQTRYPLEQIGLVEFNDAYTRRLALLEKWSDRPEQRKSKTTRQLGAIHRVLRTVAASGDFVHITMAGDTDSFACRVIACDSQCARLQACDDNVSPMQESVIRLDRIQQVTYGGSMELAERWLWELRSKPDH